MPKLRCSSSGTHPRSTWCGACQSQKSEAYNHRQRCTGIQKLPIPTEQLILCCVCNTVSVYGSHVGDCDSAMCKDCIVVHISNNIDEKKSLDVAVVLCCIRMLSKVCLSAMRIFFLLYQIILVYTCIVKLYILVYTCIYLY